jgi:outer membrane protein assembly factor BamB
MMSKIFITICAAILFFITCVINEAAPISPLDDPGVYGGLVVHVGCGDGEFIVALSERETYLIQGLDSEPENVLAARERLQTENLTDRASVDSWDGRILPYVDNIVNLLLIDDPSDLNTLREEATRVLAPRGVLMANDREAGIWRRLYTKPVPETIDDWTHFLYGPTNNAVAEDSEVGLPRTLQWECGPKYSRSHEMDVSIAASVTEGGRLISIVDRGPAGLLGKNIPDNWVIEARDAFSGVKLWERPMGHWNWTVWKPELLELEDWTSLIAQRRLVPATLPRRLVAVEGRVYLTFGIGEPVTVLDATSGETIRVYEGTKGADEILVDDVLTGPLVRNGSEPLPTPKGVLLLTVRDAQRETSLTNPELSLQARSSRSPMDVQEDGRIVALEADTGRLLWETPEDRVVPFTLTAENNRVFYHNSEELVCLDETSGQELWRQPDDTTISNRWDVRHILIAHEDLVFLSLPKSKCCAFDAASGELLWTSSGGRGSAFNTTPMEMFIIDELLWFTSNKELQGRDLRTGEIARTIELPTFIHTPGHHLRCYRARATSRFILDNKRGIEYMDIMGDEHQKNDWVRGACRYGILPANGLIYSTPTPCSCYQTALLKGFNALSDEIPPEPEPFELIKGPSFGTELEPPSDASDSDWPTFRRNTGREGSATTSLGPNIRQSWTQDLGGRLTQPIVADGRLYVCSREKRTLYALNASTGDILWTFSTPAEIDSSPTYFQGMLLFGCRNGWVYNLSAADGEQIWSFRAAPTERRIVSYGSVESSWPVIGSLLVLEEEDRTVVYAAAGRNSYLDGGIYLYGLDVVTGEIAYTQRIFNPAQDNEARYEAHEIDGAQPDVMVFDGTYISMQSKVFDRELNPVRTPAAPHIYASGGFLDDQAWHRNFWLYASGWTKMNKFINMFPNVGQLLVHEEDRIYGVKYFTQSQGQSRVFYPEQQGYYLFCDSDEDVRDDLLIDMLDPSGATPSNANTRQSNKNWQEAEATIWNAWIPVRVRAMVKTGPTLFVAGPPDLIPEDDPSAPFEGRATGELRAFNAESGEEIEQYQLPASPVFDGLIAADGCLFMSLENGTLQCWNTP